jgi:peptide/nickel transport system ATP-binding protein/oligopeptide transport system ATP-binding protein
MAAAAAAVKERGRPGLGSAMLTDAAAPLLDVSGLTVGFGQTSPVDGIAFTIASGEMLGLVGESGSGKSLTLRAILGLLPPQARIGGRIAWQGTDLLTMTPQALNATIRGKQIAMVFQEPMTALDPVLPIGLQITESLTVHRRLHGGAARRRAIELLDLVGIPDAARRLDAFPHEFSGGMRQRAMIAIALAPGPRLLLADEPTTALDVTIQDQILKLLLRLRAELAMSVILVTHDLGVVAETCDRVAVLYAGRMMETADVTTLFGASAHPYTRGLIASVPDARHARQTLFSIQGAPPDPRALPPGCRFAPRCGYAIAACDAGQPPALDLAPGHQSACLRARDLP